MNTNIAICGRPEPSEPCNHTANPLCQPVKIAPTAKLIPWNEITAKSRPQPWQSEAPSLGAAEENSALICFYRCLPAGILSSLGRIPFNFRLGPGVPSYAAARYGFGPDCSERNRALSPS